MSGTQRKQAPRLARPAARYWKGKAPKGVADVPSDSDEDDVPEVEEGDVLIGGEQDIVNEDNNGGVPLRKDATKATKAMNVSLKDVSISRDGKVTVAGREESGRTVMEEDGGFVS
jgi:microfibrillar-associated protein 1